MPRKLFPSLMHFAIHLRLNSYSMSLKYEVWGIFLQMDHFVFPWCLYQLKETWCFWHEEGQISRQGLYNALLRKDMHACHHYRHPLHKLLEMMLQLPSTHYVQLCQVQLQRLTMPVITISWGNWVKAGSLLKNKFCFPTLYHTGQEDKELYNRPGAFGTNFPI